MKDTKQLSCCLLKQEHLSRNSYHLLQPPDSLSRETAHLRPQLQRTFSAMLYSTSSIFMQVGSQSCPKRMTTTRSSSDRMAWSTCQPLCKCGNMYDILAVGCGPAGRQQTPGVGSSPPEPSAAPPGPPVGPACLRPAPPAPHASPPLAGPARRQAAAARRGAAMPPPGRAPAAPRPSCLCPSPPGAPRTPGASFSGRHGAARPRSAGGGSGSTGPPRRSARRFRPAEGRRFPGGRGGRRPRGPHRARRRVRTERRRGAAAPRPGSDVTRRGAARRGQRAAAHACPGYLSPCHRAAADTVLPQPGLAAAGGLRLKAAGSGQRGHSRAPTALLPQRRAPSLPRRHPEPVPASPGGCPRCGRQQPHRDVPALGLGAELAAGVGHLGPWRVRLSLGTGRSSQGPEREKSPFPAAQHPHPPAGERPGHRSAAAAAPPPTPARPAQPAASRQVLGGSAGDIPARRRLEAASPRPVRAGAAAGRCGGGSCGAGAGVPGRKQELRAVGSSGGATGGASCASNVVRRKAAPPAPGCPSGNW